jgi:uncharacterized cofD-like protein
MARIVCIGGGTGLYTLLSGLKAQFPADELAAVVTMMDSGSNSGRLRDEHGYLPPGDVRQSLVAFSDSSQELRALMQHRFQGDNGLNGYVVGNILLTALKDIYNGDEYEAISAMARILRIRGQVYPVTTMDSHLVATLEDSTEVRGETNIDVPKHDPSKRITGIYLDPPAILFGRTAQAIREADYIIIGPGDLYTSIMPNLVVDGMIEALKEAKSHGARIIYVTNTMTKHGETNEFAASDFVNVVQGALDGARIDAVIINKGMISDEQRASYALEHAEPVADDLDPGSCCIISGDLVSKRTFARHHPQKLANAVARAIHALGRSARSPVKS